MNEFSLNYLFRNQDGDLNILSKGLKAFLVFVVIRISIKVFYFAIDKIIENRKHRIFSIDEKKANTLTTVLKNIMKYTLYFIGAVIVLDIFNINTNSILATAGIGGLAIGFGAQSLVKDVITGFFILFEDQFSIGDYIKIDSFEGVVEELGVRTTKLRDFSGELHIIPNGNLNIVTNKTRGAMRALIKISIAYEENIDRVIKVLDEVCGKLKQSNESIVEGPTILGVTDLGEYGINITIIAKTRPMEQWSVERALRKNVKEAFDKEGIQIPYPRIVVLDQKL